MNDLLKDEKELQAKTYQTLIVTGINNQNTMNHGLSMISNQRTNVAKQETIQNQKWKKITKKTKKTKTKQKPDNHKMQKSKQLTVSPASKICEMISFCLKD